VTGFLRGISSTTHFHLRWDDTLLVDIYGFIPLGIQTTTFNKVIKEGDINALCCITVIDFNIVVALLKMN
jgi:hypothetical protein